MHQYSLKSQPFQASLLAGMAWKCGTSRSRSRGMARVIRPLRQWPLLHHHFGFQTALSHLLLPSLTSSSKITSSHFLTSTALPASSYRRIHYQSHCLKLPDAPTPSGMEEEEEEEGEGTDSDSDVKKSRNQLKREARRAVRWGMELASFSPPQIKRILRVALLEAEVFEALMLVKRLGRDVREGKRRQYNFIGKLLRDAEPQLMEALISSTKDGDWSRLRAFPAANRRIGLDEDAKDEEEKDEEEKEEEIPQEYINIASRWFNGLVNKDVKVTNEVFAVRSDDFDRQELRKLVRIMHAAQELMPAAEENEGEVEAARTAAKKKLIRFLRDLAKQMRNDSNHIDS